MADIDTLDIKISSESSDAVDKVNALTSALERLKNVLGGLDSATNKISEIGNAAQKAMPKGSAKKRQALARAKGDKASGVQSGQLPKPQEITQDFNVSTTGVDKYTDALNEAADATANLKSASAGAGKTLLGKEFSEASEPTVEDGAPKTKLSFDPGKLAQEIAKADYEAQKAENTIATLQQRLSDLTSKQGQGIDLHIDLEDAESKITDLQEKLSQTKAALADMKEVGGLVDDSSSQQDLRYLQEVINAYKDKKFYSDLAQKSAQDSMRFSERTAKSELDAARQQEQALKAQRTQDASGLSKTIASYTKELDAMDKSVAKVQSKLDALKNATNLSKEFGGSTAIQDASEKMTEFGSKTEEAREILGQMQNVLNEFKGSGMGIEDAKAQVESLAQSFEKVSDAANASKYSVRSALSGVTVNVSTTQKVEMGTSDSRGSAQQIGLLDKLIAKYNQLEGVATKFSSRAGSAISSFAKGSMSALGDSVQRVGSYFGGRFIGPVQNAIKTFDTWKSSIGRIAFYRAVRSAVKEVTDGFKTGINNLYEYSRAVGSDFAPAMNSLATSAQYLKNSLGAMAAPLITALAPAIDFIIDKIVTLLNLIGKLFAALTGRGFFTQAKKQATDFGGAVGGAAGSAKELRDYVLGIDELNIIDDNSGGGGGGGGGGGYDFSDMFEEVPLPDWAQKIKDAIAAGDWYGAGAILAEHLNSILDTWDSYAWGNALGTKIEHALEFALGFLRTFNFDVLGQKIAEGLEGIVDAIDPTVLGQTIGAAINALWDTINGFVTTLPWEKFGNFIAQAFNGWQDEIHWDVIGQTISAGLKGLFGMINTAISGIRWGDLGANVATMLNNIDWYGIIFRGLMVIVNSIKAFKEFADSFIATLDWAGIAKQIYTAINDAIVMMDWVGIGQTLGNLFIHIFDFARDIIAGIDWFALGKDIGQFLSAIDWAGIFDSLKSLINEAVKGLVLAVRGFIDGASPEVITAIAGAIAFIFAGSKLKLIAAIAGAIALIKDQMKGIGVAIAEAINKIDLVGAISGMAKTLSDALIGILDFLIGFVETLDWYRLGQQIIESLTVLIEDIDWGGIVSRAVTLIGDVLKGAADLISGLIQAIDWNRLGQDIFNAVKDMVTSIDWAAVVSTIFEILGEVLGAATNLVIGLAEAIGNAIGDAVEAAKEYFQEKIEECGGNVVLGILKGIGDAILGIGQWIKDNIFQPFIDGFKAAFGIHSPSTVMAEQGGYIVEGLIQGITNGIKGILDAIGSIVTAVTGALSGAWEGIKTAASTAWTGIKNVITGAWDNIKTTASTVWSNISKVVNDAWEGVSEKVHEVWEDVSTWLSDTWENIKTTAGNVWGNIKETVGNAWEGVKTTTTNVWNGVTTWLGNTWNSLFGKEKEEFGNMETDIGQKWDNTSAKTNETWGSQQSFLDETWNGLKTVAETAFGGMYTAVDTNWTQAMESTSQNWNSAHEETTRIWGDMSTEADKKFNEMWNTVDTKTGDMKTSSGTNWGLTKEEAYVIWKDMAGENEAKFQEMWNTVDLKTGEILKTSSTNWGETKTDMEGKLGEMSTSTDTEYGNMHSTVNSETEAMSDKNKTEWTAMQAAMLAQQVLMGTNTVFQMAAVKKSFVTALEQMNTEGTKKINDIATAMDKAMKKMVEAVKGNASNIRNALNSGIQAAYNSAAKADFTPIGRYMMEGVATGIMQRAQQVANQAANVIYNTMNTMRNAARIGSPSKLFRDEVGVWIGEGVAVGIEDSQDTVNEAVVNLNNNMKETLTEGLSGTTNDIDTILAAGWDKVIEKAEWAWGSIEKTMNESMGTSTETVNHSMEQMAAVVHNALIMMTQSVNEETAKLSQDAGNNLGELQSTVGEKLKLVSDAVKNINWEAIGKETIEGVSTGVGTAAELLKENMAKVINQTVDEAKSKAGITTTFSQLFKDEVGEKIDAGVAEGIDESTDTVTTSIKDLNTDMKDAFGIELSDVAETVSSGITVTWDKAIDLTHAAWDKILEMVHSAHGKLKEMVEEASVQVGDGIAKMWQEIESKFTYGSNEITNIVTDRFTKLISAITTSLKKVSNSITNMDWRKLGRNVSNGIAEGISTDAEKITEALAEAMQDALKTTKAKFGITISSSTVFRKHIGQAISNGIADGIKDTRENAISALADLTKDMANKYNLAIKEMGTDIKSSISTIWGEVTAVTTQSWGKIKIEVSNAMTAINTSIESKRNSIGDAFAKIWDNAEQAARVGMDSMKSIVYNGMGGVVSGFVSRVHEMAGAVQRVSWGQLGQNIVNGVTQGVIAEADKLVTAVEDTAKAALDNVKTELGIHSPSQVFKKEVGVNIGLGIAEGIRSTSREAVSSVIEISERMQKAFEQHKVNAEEALEFSKPPRVQVEYAVRYALEADNESDAEDTTESIENGVRNANEGIIDTLNNMAMQMIEAINSVARRPVNVAIGRQTLVQEVERGQRERGADIMSGGVLT